MKLLRKILVPIVPIYYLVTWIRNRFYDWGIFKSKRYAHPVICVGNLSTGGTGKSPMIELLINLFKDSYQVATLSRGYKRSTKGFLLAGKQDTAKTLGDEPYQFFNKFKDAIQVAVDANRQRGIENLLKLPNKPDLILLDDAFQHRKVAAGFNILLTTYQEPYFTDWVLPTGNLREPKQGAKRAQIIVVTKCPDNLTAETKTQFIKNLKPRKGQLVCFSTIKYSSMVVSAKDSKKLTTLIKPTLVTGIANAAPLVQHLENCGLDFTHLNFPDHHEFTALDIAALEKKAFLLTTEKDFMRLKVHKSLASKLYYLPIQAVITNSEAFEAAVLNYVKRFN
ncbi:tetraacyldisaccharide 4'-kinase [Bizionia sediminis]|uniref:Tetraacyldisaccharide 4'-kinase n=1 Tax=Bizionia sediminis TaxID=1737064 RepID=A0ABW5KSQ4_9FLAO